MSEMLWRLRNVGQRIFGLESSVGFGVGSGRRKLGDDDALADKAAFPQIELTRFSDDSCTGFAKYEMDAYATTFPG